MASLLVRRFSSAPAPKCALVVGSMGQLGQEVMAHFGTAGWNTLGFDASDEAWAQARIMHGARTRYAHA